MEYHPMELHIKWFFKVPRIFSYPVQANVNLAFNLAVFGEIEGDDIGVVIVPKEFPVNCQQGFVGTKNKMKRTKATPLFFKN